MLGYNTFQEYTNTYVNQVFIKQPQFIGGASQIQTAMLSLPLKTLHWLPLLRKSYNFLHGLTQPQVSFPNLSLFILLEPYGPSCCFLHMPGVSLEVLFCSHILFLQILQLVPHNFECPMAPLASARPSQHLLPPPHK